MLPILAQMRVYQKDILYGQGDNSEEIFFIVAGRVKFYYNIFFNEPEKQPLMRPFNMHV
jgi:hypothetical protein